MWSTRTLRCCRHGYTVAGRSVLPMMVCRRQYRFPEPQNVPMLHGFRPLQYLAIILNTQKPFARLQLNYVHANHLFDKSSHRELYTLNCLLTSYLRKGDPQATWALFRHIHCTDTGVDVHTVMPILGACSVLPDSRHGKQVHGLMVRWGTDTHVVPKTALIRMYSKHGLMEESVRLFDEVESKDVVTWNTLISGFVCHGMPKRALGVFEEMGKEGVQFSEVTLCYVLKACTLLKALRQGMQVHALVVLMGRDLVALGTTLIEFYSNIGLIDEALKIYGGLSSKQDDIMCNAFIAGCLKNQRYEEAYLVMCSRVPNVVSLTSALSSSSENANLRIGKQIHCVATRLGFEKDTQFCNVLLDMYAKCGRISTARIVFDRMPHRDVISWTSMINGYGSHGFGVEAVELFAIMEEEGSGVVSPNEVTLLAVLSACSHSGLVEQGRLCFGSIRAKYGLTPCPQHYACYIDILGRASHIEQVWSAYDHMVNNGCKPTDVVWAALLNACVLNNDATGGEFAAKHLLALDSDKPGINVLLSNFYAAVGKWEVVDQLRRKMKNKGLCKDMGSSWVSVSDSKPNVVPC
ncbi:hypothetical protein Dimus_017295 [Dionaea muscipula]